MKYCKLKTVKKMMAWRNGLDYRYIYILGNTRYWFRYKIGIARDVQARKGEIDRTLKGDVYDIFWIKVFFAMRIEQFMHFIYGFLSAKMRGSGKTEWFWMIFPITPILFLIIVWAIQWAMLPLIFAALLWVVRDSGLFS